jgi:hypothetical protein
MQTLPQELLDLIETLQNSLVEEYFGLCHTILMKFSSGQLVVEHN